MRIHVFGNFYIEASARGFILKEEYEGRTKDGLPRKGERNHGFHTSIASAVKRCLELNVLNGAKAVELWEYAKMVEESNKLAAKSVQKEIETLMKEGKQV